MEGGEHGYVRSGIAAGAGLGGVHLDLTGDVRRDQGRLNDDFFDGEELVARALWAARPGATLGALVRADDSRTGVPFSSGVPTPQTTISWQERELALPFDATGGPWAIPLSGSGKPVIGLSRSRISSPQGSVVGAP